MRLKRSAKARQMAERVTVRRCAIYVRKSSDEGLDMSYNSLEAQADACAAYVASQRHEGWTKLPKVYEDGGYSGGNMDRPGLKELLKDVEAGKVDIIVVYKIDRLTRSLTDFAKLNDVLDRHQCVLCRRDAAVQHLDLDGKIDT